MYIFSRIHKCSSNVECTTTTKWHGIQRYAIRYGNVCSNTGNAECLHSLLPANISLYFQSIRGIKNPVICQPSGRTPGMWPGAKCAVTLIEKYRKYWRCVLIPSWSSPLPIFFNIMAEESQPGPGLPVCFVMLFCFFFLFFSFCVSCLCW